MLGGECWWWLKANAAEIPALQKIHLDVIRALASDLSGMAHTGRPLRELSLFIDLLHRP